MICTLTAGWQKLFSDNPAISFLTHSAKYQKELDEGRFIAPAKSLDQMRQIIFNDRIDAGLCAAFMIIVIGIVIFGFIEAKKALANPQVTAKEGPFQGEYSV